MEQQRFFDTVDTPHVNRSKTRRPQHRTQTNTIAKYFQPIQAGTPRKREGQAQNRTSSKVKSRKIHRRQRRPRTRTENTSIDKREGPTGKKTGYHKLLPHLPASK